MNPATLIMSLIGCAVVAVLLTWMILDIQTGHDIKRGWFTHQAKIYKITEVPAP